MLLLKIRARRARYGGRVGSFALGGVAMLSAGLLTTLLLAAGACRAGEASLDPTPTLPGRPLPSRVAEPSNINQLQARLDALNATGAKDCDIAYQANKAQAWLNFEKYAAQNEVPAAVSSAALRNAADIVGALETHSPMSLQTPELPKARHLRDDLWRSVAAVKVDGRRCGAPKMTAYCEVQLAWVGYEATDGGWRHVDPYVRIAEDYCTTASAAVAMPVVAPVAVAAPAVDLMPPELRFASIESFSEDIDSSIFVLFPHDRSAREDIRSPGRAELAALAEHMKSLPANVVIAVMGHADITGTPMYNQALSERRAQTVATELSALGIDPSRIQLSAAGAKEPVVNCSNDKAKPQYLACLEPNRRVVVHLVGDAVEAASFDGSESSTVAESGLTAR